MKVNSSLLLMKTITSLCLLLLFAVMTSCSKDNTENEKYLTVDYKTDLGFFKDLTINTDNKVYALSTVSGTDEEQLELQKITADGKMSRLYNTPSYFNDAPKITHDDSGKLYWTALMKGAIYSFTNDYQPVPFYTMLGADQLQVRMDALCSLSEDTFAMYDGNLRKFKLYSKTQNSDFPIAGSETYAVVDGIGANAAFVWVQQMKALNNAIYALDSQRYIRKIDCSSPDYNVTTLYDSYYDIIVDFAIADNQSLYAIIKNKGICKLENGHYTVLKSGTEKIQTANNNAVSTIDWNAISKIYIKGSDLYLISGYGTLTKISNFAEKL